MVETKDRHTTDQETETLRVSADQFANFIYHRQPGSNEVIGLEFDSVMVNATEMGVPSFNEQEIEYILRLLRRTEKRGSADHVRKFLKDNGLPGSVRFNRQHVTDLMAIVDQHYQRKFWAQS